jgi:hypothetical protein
MYTGRTKKYAETIIRGDNFDYKKWLRQVKEEEAQEKRVAAASNSSEPTSPKLTDVIPAAGVLSPSKSSPALRVNKGQTFHAPTWEIRSPNAKPRKKKGLGQRLLHVSHVWDDFQVTRDRDAVYPYLVAVYSVVQRYRRKGRTKKLMRHAFKFAELPFDKNADPFAVIIRCTCEGELDNKTISKFSRALRFVAHVKKRKPLKEFMKARGGINACASLYTKYLGRNKTMSPDVGQTDKEM